MATRELKWDENKQAFVGSRLGDVYGISVTLDELPDDAQIKYNKKTGKEESVTVPFEFAQEQLNKTKERESAVGTKEEFLKAQQDITNKLPDGSPLPNQKVRFNVSRSDIIKGKEILVGPQGVVYIDPEATSDDAAGVQVVIKPTGFSGFGYGGGQGGEYKGFEVVSAETEVANVINQARKTAGGIKELKSKLFQSGFYNQAQVQNPAKSIRMGDAEDADMQAALAVALQTQSIANYGFVQQNKNALDFDGWIEEATAAFAGSEDVKTVNLPGKLTAEQAAISSYQRFLGRTPNQNEILAFMSAANEYARANPNVSSMDYLSGTATQINQPGFNEQELNSFAEDYATAQPGAAEYGLGQGGYETFNGAVNILLNELSAQGARRVKPGDK
jgi:hypothetical protein